MATDLPSFNTPLWTWPMDAAANGVISNSESLSRQLAPSSFTSTFCGKKKNFSCAKTQYRDSATLGCTPVS